MHREDFFEQVWDLVSQIPCGFVTTYGDIAKMLGHPQHSRLAGAALHYAPEGLPCHRVVSSSGRCAPYWPEQPRLLLLEGITFSPKGRVNLSRHRWQGL